MKASISLGRWFGIPVGLHYSWFVIAWLITMTLVGQFAAMNHGWSPAKLWGLAVVTSLLFFVCIVLHELAHASVARASGIPVRGITLFALGGLAQIQKDAATPAKEFWMAIAGPAASFVIGFICRALAVAAGFVAPNAASSAVGAVFGWLAYINIALAVFNLIPGFPLDGGRVLRSIAWAATRSATRATRIAARVGQITAFLFIAAGLISLLSRGNFGGLWLAIIGVFLLQTARAYDLQSRLSTALDGVRVADVMVRDCAAVDGADTLAHFVETQVLRRPDRCFVVQNDHHVVGVVTPEDVTRIERERWPRTIVTEVMHPLDSLHPVEPDAPASDALELMGVENMTQLPVIHNGHLEGIVTQSSLIHLLQVRRQLAV